MRTWKSMFLGILALVSAAGSIRQRDINCNMRETTLHARLARQSAGVKQKGRPQGRHFVLLGSQIFQ